MENEIIYPKRIEAARGKILAVPLNIILIIALCIELFTPFLIDKGFLPSQVRYVSHAVVALMLAFAISRMIIFDYIPFAVIPMLCIAAIWSFIALARGQGIATTLWGVWLFLQFAFVGLFTYLEPGSPTPKTGFLLKTVFGILVIHLLIQLLQYASGIKIGDYLAGLFTSGAHGTGDSILFILLANCLFLGHWIATKQWKGMVGSLAIGVLAGTFGEVKLYPFVVAVLAIIAVLFFAVRHGSFFKTLLFVVLIIGVLAGFLNLYNFLVPAAQKHPLQEFLTDPNYLGSYLNQTNTLTTNGNTRILIRRGDALALGWDSLVQDGDPIIFLFGYGIGARSESRSLGTSGIGFSSTAGDVGTSLLVMMQEMGVLGLASIAGFMAWVIIVMIRDIRRYPDSPDIGLRYAMLLFSLLWPVWLWYTAAWAKRVPMLFYWMLLGYLLAETQRPLAKLRLINLKSEEKNG